MKTSTLVLDLHKAALRTRTGTGLVTLVAIISLTVSSTIAYLVAGGTWMFYQRSLRPQDFHVVQESLANGPDDPIMSTWVIMALFACAFLVPTIVSLTAQAAVLGASGREKRLATLRLIGLSSGDITRMTMLETAAQAAIGIVLGGFFSVLLAPIFSNMKFQDVYIQTSELILPWWGYLTVAVVVFALAVTASVVGMQRVRVEPLGVSRKEMPPALKYRSVILFVIFTVFTLIMVDRTSMSSGIAAMAIVAAVVSINVMLINWVAPFLLQVFYRMVSIMPGTSHFVASQRIAADAKTTWRRSASMAFFGVIAGYLVISPVGEDGLTAMMSEEPGIFMMFRDLAMGGVLTLVFGFILSAMSVFLGLASQIFEQAHLSRSLHLMGVQRNFYFRTQVFETLGPVVIVSLIGFTFGVMLGSVMLSSGIADVNFPMRLSMAGSILGIGWLFPLAAIAAVEPLRTRTLNVGRNND
ncbi:FtsX-like permease family protein [Corynebacterium stationis]|uniref:FtsX-like permease family protein n=1 Tax=Corynebacterium stationis TaxID=1705 RepID=UPI00076F5C06|nr:FtsX-like permease family protein [Corynebacterium stationis]AMJ43877.1 ABC transporter permease [Corynebacterium stationis]APT94205.1 ABC transporter permease [Corynebacterium stationis]AQX70332.1 ABC transporter permease [Corynebacterium stationis]ASJ18027.1 ABC transporter permease [Corynebacterium stationis]HJG64761.1 FtsX-like permease family protein [Corynebacterium stationis]